jgi:hypothetical protein
MARNSRGTPRWFVGASLVTTLGVLPAGCGSTVGQNDSAPPVDTGTPEATTDTPAVFYGPVVVDSGTPDAAADDTPAAWYGPVQVDAGMPDATDAPVMAYYGPIRVDSGS